MSASEDARLNRPGEGTSAGVVPEGPPARDADESQRETGDKAKTGSPAVARRGPGGRKRSRRRLLEDLRDPLVVARFKSKIMLAEQPLPAARWLGPCHLWEGSLSGGYGVFPVHGQWRATEVALHLAGRQRPPGFTVDHLCHTYMRSCRGGPFCPHKACVSPAHLEWVSQSLNSLRAQVNRRMDRSQRYGVTSPACPQGHAYLPGTYRYVGIERDCLACLGDSDWPSDWQAQALTGAPVVW